MIKLSHVSMRYDGDDVVRDVSLELPPSGLTALIGANGAGKSTLLSGIGRLLPCSGGEITFEGTPLKSWRPRDLARRLAILRQDNHLSVRLSVAELVALGRHPYSRGSLTSVDERAIEEALACVSMSDLADRFIDELSGGQRQRAFVAMTLAQDADYLLLDEPLAALDLYHGRELMRHLRRIVDDKGTAIVVVLHDVNTAAAYADRLVAMRDGALVAEGSPEQVMTEETLSDVFSVETRIVEVNGHPVAVPLP